MLKILYKLRERTWQILNSELICVWLRLVVNRIDEFLLDCIDYMEMRSN